MNFTVNNVPRSLRRAPNGFKRKAGSEVAVNLHLNLLGYDREQHSVWAGLFFFFSLGCEGGSNGHFLQIFPFGGLHTLHAVDTNGVRLEDAEGLQ